MLFCTITFLIFLAAVFTLYWSLTCRTWQNALLLVCSYAFYAWWDYRFCALMLISSLVDFFVGIGLNRTGRPASRRLLLSLSLLCNLGLLGFFKYFNFFSESLAILLQRTGMNVDPVLLSIVLPVGISFYTFQTLSYTIDIYRGHLKATTHLIDYMAYVSFFPQLVAGPIERASNLLPQFLNARRFDPELVRDGLRLMLWGFVKKLALADNLAPIVNRCYAAPETVTGEELTFATVCFAFQIYCDFSAYSDIARGTARLFGFRLMRNFNHPYFSQDLGEFWRRWHISLSTWFRDYVYIPLGGRRVRLARRAVNIFLTFVISGLWHGASWNFIVWGALNGLGVLPSLLARHSVKRDPVSPPGGNGLFPRPLVLLKMLITFSLICMAWVFFRARTLDDALLVAGRIVRAPFSGSLLMPLTPDNVRMSIFLLVFVCIEWIHRGKQHPLRFERFPKPVRWLCYSLIIWWTIYAGVTEPSDFIYFQF